MTLQEEAEKWASDYTYANGKQDIGKESFIAGATSKYVKKQILNAKIEGLMLANDNPSGIFYRIEELEQQLKELEK